jgi:ElaB/YqjD/DUF883 family membrane-anchored ribosome-binding protein
MIRYEQHFVKSNGTAQKIIFGALDGKWNQSPTYPLVSCSITKEMNMTTPQTQTNTKDKSFSLDKFADDGNASNDIRSMKQSGADLAQHLKANAQEFTKLASNEARHKLDDFKTYAGTQLKGLENGVVAKPVQSVAIAFAVGAVLSLLLSRR